jgi:eukaryotic-like serine/threonine-protein kinase
VWQRRFECRFDVDATLDTLQTGKSLADQLREQLQATLGDSLVLEQELGGGGMSRVFVAHDASLGRKVVVKVLPPEMAAAVSVDRFRREIQLAAQLQHPHIVPLLAAGETNGLPYYTMPFVRGDSLRAKLGKSGELTVSETVRILREVASALSYAHENGVVHRDIKPENVLISGGSAVVTDFGVAKALTASSGAAGSLTPLGVALGTPAYMAPEQASADPTIDHRADIYALGVMAYEMLTGSTPFGGRSAQATLAAQVIEAPDPVTRRRATVPPLLSAIVMKCLEKRASDRPQTASDVMHELDAMVTPSGRTEPTRAMASVSASDKSRGRLIAVSVAVLALIAIAGTVLFKYVKTARQPAASPEAPALAVMPFENVGRKEGQEFTDGMTEEITNRLASLQGLRVVGRQSVKSYAGTTKTTQQIARELGVKYVLTGTVRWDKDASGKVLVRVSPALLRADDATQMWADEYQTVLSGMFEVQSKLATDVANALDVKLLAPDRAQLAAKLTDNPEAEALYLRADAMLNFEIEPDRVRQAVATLQKAVTLDPKFAIAYARLAYAHTEMYFHGSDHSPARLDSAKVSLEKAAAINPDLPEVHFARGVYYYQGFFDYEKASAQFAIVERVRPNDFWNEAYLGFIARRQGNFEASIPHLRRAVELEPRNGVLAVALANTMVTLRRWDEATPLIGQALILDPTDVTAYDLKMEVALGQSGNIPAALSAMRDAKRNGSRAAFLGFLIGNFWPALLDPELKQDAIDARWSPDVMSHASFLRQKSELWMYLGDSLRMKQAADSSLHLATAEISRHNSETDNILNVAFDQATLGHRAAALEALDKAASLSSKDAFALSGFDLLRGEILLVTGDHDGAITMFEKSLAHPGGINRNLLRLDPFYAPLRSNPRFQRLLQGN